MENHIDSVLKKITNHESTISAVLGISLLVIASVITTRYFLGSSPQITETAVQTEADEKSALSQNEIREGSFAQHTVVAGETLWIISQKYYQSGYNWTDIATFNQLQNPSLIEPGTQLQLPDVDTLRPDGSRTPRTSPPEVIAAATRESSAAENSSTAPETTSLPSTYEVKPGDNLWLIAHTVYKDGHQWNRIWAANRNRIPNPSVIESGWQLTIPKT